MSNQKVSIGVCTQYFKNTKGETWETYTIAKIVDERSTPLMMIRSFAKSTINHGKFLVMPYSDDIGEICNSFDEALKTATRLMKQYFDIDWSPK